MNNHERYLVMIRRIDQELGWQLSAQEQLNYAATLRQHVPEHCPENQLREIIINYHADHALVEILQDRRHSHHEASWTAWVTQVLSILRRAGLNWATDTLFEEQDLAQIARAELVQAIGSFHFASRFSTWAHKVIVQSVQRAIRDSQALKRAVRPDSLEQYAQVDAPISDAEHPESVAAAGVLAQRVATILEAQANQRLAHIFYLWAVADVRVEEIGKIMHLHPSRIRALLQQARQILRDAPEIRSWHEDTDDQQRAHGAE